MNLGLLGIPFLDKSWFLHKNPTVLDQKGSDLFRSLIWFLAWKAFLARRFFNRFIEHDVIEGL